MAWIYLASAGLFEIGCSVGLKMAQQNETRVVGIVSAAAFGYPMLSGRASGWPKYFLWVYYTVLRKSR